MYIYIISGPCRPPAPPAPSEEIDRVPKRTRLRNAEMDEVAKSCGYVFQC